jgi:hypothetical protein
MSTKQLFILLLAPLTGLLFDAYWNRRGVLWTFWICVVLLFPALLKYDYSVSFIAPLACLLAGSSLYYFLTADGETVQWKIRTCILITFLGACISVPFALRDALSGSTRVEKRWNIGNHEYKIEYISSQGFAGGSSMSYRISRYTYIPILLKVVDGAHDDGEKSDPCLVHFDALAKEFNTCTGTLTESRTVIAPK